MTGSQESADGPRRGGAAPLPYAGPRAERHARLGAPWSTVAPSGGPPGERRYRFSSLGHRGDEFRPDARMHAFVFGGGDAFGLGVGEDETWAHRAATAEADRRGVRPDELCVTNLADPGLSTDAIVREVLVQCAAFRPDLALIQIAPARRGDGVLDGVPYPLGSERATAEATRPSRGTARERWRAARLAEERERARAFLRFCDGEQGLLATVRALLLAQSFLRAAGIRGVAIAGDPAPLRSEFAREHPVIGPLLALLDPGFLLLDVALGGRADGAVGERPDAGAHARAGAEVARRLAGATDPLDDGGNGDTEATVGDGIADVEPVGAAVRAFYTELPFNAHGTPEGAAAAVRRPTVERQYPDLYALLTRRRGAPRCALEIGCGAGWLSNALALHHGLEVDAIDLTPAALDRAREVADLVGTADRVRFRECDVFRFASPLRWDLAVSVGALHHTGDARRAFTRLARHVAPGGHAFVGLYHGPSRRIFLDEMGRVAREEGEDAAFERYRALDRVHADDPTLARSWFRDQVLHPHETQHTLEEVWGWLDGLGFVLESTSLAAFRAPGSRADAPALDAALAERSRRALFEERRYFPGFFTVLARRAEARGPRGPRSRGWRLRP